MMSFLRWAINNTRREIGRCGILKQTTESKSGLLRTKSRRGSTWHEYVTADGTPKHSTAVLIQQYTTGISWYLVPGTSTGHGKRWGTEPCPQICNVTILAIVLGCTGSGADYSEYNCIVATCYYCCVHGILRFPSDDSYLALSDSST